MKKLRGIRHSITERIAANQRKAADVQSREDREREAIRLLNAKQAAKAGAPK